jgi:hypothetical protein
MQLEPLSNGGLFVCGDQAFVPDKKGVSTERASQLSLNGFRKTSTAAEVLLLLSFFIIEFRRRPDAINDLDHWGRQISH